MGNPYIDVRVSPGNVLLGTWRVACTNGTVRMYEDFDTKKEAEFWAQALRDGEWEEGLRRLRNIMKEEGL